MKELSRGDYTVIVIIRLGVEVDLKDLKNFLANFSNDIEE